MLLNLHKKTWMDGLCLMDYTQHCKNNEKTVKVCVCVCVLLCVCVRALVLVCVCALVCVWQTWGQVHEYLYLSTLKYRFESTCTLLKYFLNFPNVLVLILKYFAKYLYVLEYLKYL